MILRICFVYLVGGALLRQVESFWGEQFLGSIVAVFEKETNPEESDQLAAIIPKRKVPKSNQPCDENQLMLQLARLYIISPERIVLLLTTESIDRTCKEITDVQHHINTTLTTCAPLGPDNLYTRLIDGLNYFHQFICEYDDRSKIKHINQYHNCIKELREDVIDCEGPADWFEKPNKTIVCPFYTDIANCNYIKAATLCGLTPALMLRTFTTEILKRVVVYDCKVSRSLPHVDDPMPSTGNRVRDILFYRDFFTLSFVLILGYTLLANIFIKR